MAEENRSMIELYNELTFLEGLYHNRRVDSPQYYFDNGWRQFSSHLKQEILVLRENTNETDTIKKLDELYDFCKKHELKGLSYAPTVISEKKWQPF